MSAEDLKDLNADLGIMEIEAMESNTIPPKLSGMPERGSSRIVFEAERYARHGGVSGCMGELNRMIQRLVDDYALRKERELGRRYLWKGHAGGSYRHNSGRKPWPDNSRYCGLSVSLKCVVVFEA